MTNREKLLDALNKMSDEELAHAIDLSCIKCPARTYCNSDLEGFASCQELRKNWLRSEEK